MKIHKIKSLLFAIACTFCVVSGHAATSLFSNYGQIQNVQNYSSNPFWTPNSPYNQRLPQPVYVQGADLNTEDCIKVVQSLVYVQCSARDNCKNTTLAEIRPTIMVQLSNLPGNNYVSACAGYLDYIFESYVAQFGNEVPNHPVAFPTAIDSNPNVNNYQNNSGGGGVQIQNPYQQTVPKWQQEMNEREQELKDLQTINGGGQWKLTTTDFPTTIQDLSFAERMDNKAEGYAPFKDKSAYVSIETKNEAEWCSEHLNSPECAAYKARLEELAKKHEDTSGSGSTPTDPGSGFTDPGSSSTDNTAQNQTRTWKLPGEDGLTHRRIEI